MFSKLSFKIVALFVFIIAFYMLFVINFISKNVIDYSVNVEIKNTKSELQKIVKLIEEQTQTIRTFEQLSLQNHKNRIKDMANVGKKIFEDYNEQIVNYGLSIEKAKKMAYEKILDIRYGQNDYFYVLDAKGTLIAHPDMRFKGKNLLHSKDIYGKSFGKEIMEEANQTGESFGRYWWYKDGETKPSEKLTYTIYFKPWNVYLTTGVYIDDIDEEVQKQKAYVVSSLKSLISRIHLIKSGYIYIVDNNAKMIIHPNEKLINLNVGALKEPKTGEFLFDKIVNASGIGKPLRYFWNTPADLDNYIYKKVAWVDYNYFFNWYIVASVYEEEFELEANRLNSQIFNISIIVFLILAIVGFLSIKYLISPLEELSNQAILAQHGDLKTRSNIKQNDEIGILAKQFNYMLDIVEDNVKNLENEVQTRTQELHNKLYFDDITNLGSKYALFEKIDKKSYGTVFLINIDSFNSINELYGYTTGNIILKEFGELLERLTKGGSFSAYRLYADIFVLYENEEFTNINVYENFVSKIFNSTKRNKFLIKDLDNLDIDIDITIGIAFCQEQPVKKANIALNLAKRNQKNLMVYNNELDDKENILNSIYWRKKIKISLENSTLIPFYQPIVNRDKKIIKYETLMRIADKSGDGPKYISPVYFQEVAIKTKQYTKLSEVIIKKAFADMKRVKEQISINLSYTDIKEKELVELIISLLENNKENSHRVVFEILESANISDYNILNDFIHKVREYSVKIAIDDFGTGYSNFTHILNLRPDYVKIDGSLIKDICSDRNSYEVVKSIIKFSKELDIKVIAEYVHSKEVFELLLEMGVDEFQGFYFGKPESNFVTS